MKGLVDATTILLAICTGCTGRHRRSNDPALKILPSGDQEVRAGKNLVLTCRAHVPNPELISHLRWFAPSGELIPQDDRVYSEDQPGDAATALFIKKLQERDSGVYRCTAKYAANQHVEATVKISTFIGITWEDAPTEQFARSNNDYKIRCVVRANPPANIEWLKESLIISTGDQFVIESDGLLIKEIKRENAGTYTCRARVAETEELEEMDIVLDVEFGPTFEEQPFLKEWSWDQKPVNLTCIATAIPNATVTWWYKDLEIGRQDLDKNYQVVGHGPRSDLIVTPLSSKYYGRYTCKAENPFGTAYQELELEEAREPSKLRQAILDKYTATTLQFRFVAPTDSGGLPIESYAAEYKETRQEWNEAQRRVWPANQVGGYILEDLNPQTTYDLRFGCKNRVGFSNWGAGQQITTPKRGRPEPPILNKETGDGEIIDGDVIELPTPDHYEVSWRIPEDNGVPIDYYLLTYYPVWKESSNDRTIWRQVGDMTKVEIPHKGNVRWNMQLDYQDTFYKVELMAHNQLGFSPESVLIIKSGRDPTTGGTPIQPPNSERINASSPLGSQTLFLTFICLSLSSQLLHILDLTASR